MFELLYKQSCPKPGDVINEDRYRADSGLLAVADGAGGAGIFSGEWADYLLNNLPDNPLNDAIELAAWLNQIWTPFFEEYETKNLEPDIRSKFLDEGSLSTLVAVWTKKQGADNDLLLRWISYGDSVILIIDPKEGIRESSISDLRVFSESPNLINWNSEPVTGAFSAREHTVSQGTYVLLCSDALGQYLLLTNELTRENGGMAGQLEAIRQMPFRLANQLDALERAGYGKSNWMEEVLQPLMAAAENESAFKEYMYDLLNRNLIAPDDYTFLVAKVL